MGNRICVSIQLHTQKESYGHLVGLKMVTPGPDSSDGPSAHSPISRPHPWEATAAHQALELVPFPFTGQVSTWGDADRLGPSQVRIKAGGTPERHSHGFAVLAGCIHGNACPQGPSRVPCSPCSQRELGLNLLLPFLQGNPRRAVFGGPTPHS